MSIKKKGLGKGLDSLIPDNKSIKSVTPAKSAEAKKEAEEKAGVQTMKINEVEPNRDQPRKNLMKMLSLNFRIPSNSSVYYSRCLFGKERITTKSLPVKEDGELQNLPG